MGSSFPFESDIEVNLFRQKETPHFLWLYGADKSLLYSSSPERVESAGTQGRYLTIILFLFLSLFWDTPRQWQNTSTDQDRRMAGSHRLWKLVLGHTSMTRGDSRHTAKSKRWFTNELRCLFNDGQSAKIASMGANHIWPCCTHQANGQSLTNNVTTCKGRNFCTGLNTVPRLKLRFSTVASLDARWAVNATRGVYTSERSAMCKQRTIVKRPQPRDQQPGLVAEALWSFARLHFHSAVTEATAIDVTVTGKVCSVSPPQLGWYLFFFNLGSSAIMQSGKEKKPFFFPKRKSLFVSWCRSGRATSKAQAERPFLKEHRIRAGQPASSGMPSILRACVSSKAFYRLSSFWLLVFVPMYNSTYNIQIILPQILSTIFTRSTFPLEICKYSVDIYNASKNMNYQPNLLSAQKGWNWSKVICYFFHHSIFHRSDTAFDLWLNILL